MTREHRGTRREGKLARRAREREGENDDEGCEKATTPRERCSSPLTLALDLGTAATARRLALLATPVVVRAVGVAPASARLDPLLLLEPLLGLAPLLARVAERRRARVVVRPTAEVGLVRAVRRLLGRVGRGRKLGARLRAVRRACLLRARKCTEMARERVSSWSARRGSRSGAKREKKGRTSSCSMRKPQPPSLKNSYGSSLTVFMMACQLRLTGPSEKGMSTELRGGGAATSARELIGGERKARVGRTRATP